MNEYKSLYVKTKEWLREEIEEDRNVSTADLAPEESTDGTQEIIIGRAECAEDLLKQMEQWERKRGE